LRKKEGKERKQEWTKRTRTKSERKDNTTKHEIENNNKRRATKATI
jgi:hypothetical protein